MENDSPQWPRRLGLFPLPNVVHFPQAPLPLHVFEPRYRALVEDALAGDRLIGMVLLRPGWGEDYHGRPPVYETGCAGHIEQVERLPDGRYDILLRGLTRFRIAEEHAEAAYRIATVDALHDEPGDPAVLEAARRQVLAAIGRAEDGPAVLVLQGDRSHEVLVNALAQSLPLDPVEKQALLECNSVAERYRQLLGIMEFHVLERSRGGGTGGIVH